MSTVRVLRTVKEVRAWKKKFQSIGLVPTMGALHEGHLELVQRSMAMNEKTLVSVFVNPSQFAPTEDLSTYPRTLEADLASLERFGSNVSVFHPPVSEMYPCGISTNIDEQIGAFVSVDGIGSKLEGQFRPHFFRGVSTVVTKLINICAPRYTYFGQKDVQQTVVVRRLVNDLFLPTEIVICPTVRESTGLAMSSRNIYMDDTTRFKVAPNIFKALCAAENRYREMAQTEESVSAQVIKEAGLKILEATPGIQIEYFEVSDPVTLDSLDTVSSAAKASQPQHPEQWTAIISTAITLPGRDRRVRLIDNVVL
ncbi:hypothetical protein CANCADRAFT_124325 [Tortispora caseinolytica NRRL Y-17796]|uniref:Pantoate--beta-alanine ligase n=1 Tax=Tortispora caseinolytica NRRL Y-17796 TaxID=767744 RepID=A0A1E4TA57_9ASCO|nr:hypothetical protein CANCADRAFT_124325 [Tortispora caseinolytica NRRL Y-17796]